GYLARIDEDAAVETAGHPYLAMRERQGASRVRSAAYHRPFRIIGFLLVPARLAAGRMQAVVDAGFLPQVAVQREVQDQAIAHVPIGDLRVADPELPGLLGLGELEPQPIILLLRRRGLLIELLEFRLLLGSGRFDVRLFVAE